MARARRRHGRAPRRRGRSLDGRADGPVAVRRGGAVKAPRFWGQPRPSLLARLLQPIGWAYGRANRAAHAGAGRAGRRADDLRRQFHGRRGRQDPDRASLGADADRRRPTRRLLVAGLWRRRTRRASARRSGCPYRRNGWRRAAAARQTRAIAGLRRIGCEAQEAQSRPAPIRSFSTTACRLRGSSRTSPSPSWMARAASAMASAFLLVRCGRPFRLSCRSCTR